MNIQKEINLQPYNTFQFPCIASDFIKIESIEDFQQLLHTDCYKTSSKKLFLGGGSNMLLTTDRFDGLVIKNEIMGITVLEQTKETVTICVWWWENRDEFVHWSIENGYCGIENLVSIPGSIWAAPMQNIWAYWVEVWTFIKSVSYCDTTTWSTTTIDADNCTFGYRHSIFKDKLKEKALITHVTFTLQKYDPERYDPKVHYGAIAEKITTYDTITPGIVAKTIADIRASKLPDRKSLWTAWSFFKNPIISEKEAQGIIEKYNELVTYPGGKNMLKFSAWQLIDKAWCKWIIQWNVWTYWNHALILVHHWWWTWKEIVDLAQHIANTVEKKFWIVLVPEVNYVL